MPSFEDVIPSPAEVEAAFEVRAGGVRPPARSARVVAILVTGRGVERSSWSDDVEVSEDDFERLLEEQAPPPDLNDLNGAKFRTLDPGSRGAKVQRCTECRYRPADGKCLRCGGTGSILVGGDDSEQCSGCTNGIALPCAVCGGTKRAVPVKIVFGEDVLRRFAHIFLPEVPFALREPLTRFFKERASVPDVLAIDLADDFAGADAYRGRRSRAEVKGHRADAALALAKQYVERVRRMPSLAAVEAAAFAWPFAVFSGDADGSAAYAVAKDEQAQIHLFP